MLLTVCKAPTSMHGRFHFAKFSINDFGKIKIAAIHLDFVRSVLLLLSMESAE